MVDLGTLNWTLASNNYYVLQGLISGIKAPPNGSTRANAIAERYSVVTSNGVTSGSESGIGIRPNGGSYATDFGESPTGMLCYELATPTTIQLTTQQIDSLLGRNSVWADSGDVTVEYIADTKLYIQKVMGAIG